MQRPEAGWVGRNSTPSFFTSFQRVPYTPGRANFQSPANFYPDLNSVNRAIGFEDRCQNDKLLSTGTSNFVAVTSFFWVEFTHSVISTYLFLQT